MTFPHFPHPLLILLRLTNIFFSFSHPKHTAPADTRQLTVENTGGKEFYENRFLKIGRTEIPEEAIGAQGHQIGNVTSKNEYIAFLFKALVEDVFVVLPVVEVQV